MNSQVKREQVNWLIKTNLILVVLFFFLYHTDNPRPYTNILYFILMGGLALWMFKVENTLTPLVWVKGKTVWGDTALGSLLMLAFYFLTLAGYYLIPIGNQNKSWVFFTAPWKEINFLVSFLGIVIVVVALEFFYRSYVLELLRSWHGESKALIISSLLSALRGLFGGGIAACGYDFALSWFWGWIYLRAGLLAAIIIHLVWDILFVYLSPGL